MHKKSLGLFLMGTSFFFCSCVDATYDLANKKISTDVEFNNNKLSLPLGSLKPFMIDSLVNGVELISMTEDGVYCIKDSIEQYMEKYIHPIEIKLDPKSISLEQDIPTINFAYAPNIKSLPLEFNIEKEISFNSKVPNQFARVYTCSFKEELAISLNLKFNGLDIVQATAADLDFTLNFPAFFKNLRSDEEGITAEGNQVRIAKEYLPTNDEGLTIELYCSGFDFEAELEGGLEFKTDENGTAYLSHQNTMSVEGKINLRNEESGLSLSGRDLRIALGLDLSFSNVYLNVLDGVFQEEFYEANDILAIDLGDLAETLEEANKHIRLAEPYLEVVLDNNISIPLKKVDFSLFGKDSEGNIIENTVVNEEFHLHQEYDPNTGEIIPSTTKLLLTSNENLSKEGYETVETPDLAKWLEQIPDSMGYSAHPILDKSKRAHICIDQAINLNATCKTVIPLSFEKLDLDFCDTVSINLDGTLDMFSNAGLKLKMTLTNTLPVGLAITATALDNDKNPIGDITISTIEIDPCEEEDCTLQNTQNKKTVEIAIKSENLNFEDFAYLEFNYKIFTTENNQVGFRPTQGIQISDLVIEISGDIKTNINE